MPEITVRPATLADLPVVAPLFDAYRQFYEQAPDLAAAATFIGERLQRQESVILLAEAARGDTGGPATGDAIGFCQLYPSFCSVAAARIYLLYDLYVTPSARRSGAGQALLQSAAQLAAEHGMVRMDLTTARSNLGAQALYAVQGWVRDDIFLAYNKSIEPLVRPV